MHQYCCLLLVRKQNRVYGRGNIDVWRSFRDGTYREVNTNYCTDYIWVEWPDQKHLPNTSSMNLVPMARPASLFQLLETILHGHVFRLTHSSRHIAVDLHTGFRRDQARSNGRPLFWTRSEGKRYTGLKSYFIKQPSLSLLAVQGSLLPHSCVLPCDCVPWLKIFWCSFPPLVWFVTLTLYGLGHKIGQFNTLRVWWYRWRHLLRFPVETTGFWQPAFRFLALIYCERYPPTNRGFEDAMNFSFLICVVGEGHSSYVTPGSKFPPPASNAWPDWDAKASTHP